MSRSIMDVQTHWYTVTIMALVDKAVEVSRGRKNEVWNVDTEALRGNIIEAFISVFVFPLCYGKSFVTTVSFPA